MSAIKLTSSCESIASYAASISYTGAVADTTLVGAALTDASGNTVTPQSPARAIRVGTAGSGNLKVKYASGVVDVIPKLTAGQIITGKFAAVYASGSDVQDVTVFWLHARQPSRPTRSRRGGEGASCCAGSPARRRQVRGPAHGWWSHAGKRDPSLRDWPQRHRKGFIHL
jgi:hypothetical protein